MEEFELRSQILLGEDSTRQFKREPSADAKMAGEIVAFANSGGGRVFVGVEKEGKYSFYYLEQPGFLKIIKDLENCCEQL